MSQDEIRRQKAMLRQEYAEAQEQLANLSEKATRIGQQFQWFGQLMTSRPHTVVGPSTKNCHGELDLVPLHTHQIELLQLETAIAVADEARAARRTLSDLAERMKSLGIALT